MFAYCGSLVEPFVPPPKVGESSYRSGSKKKKDTSQLRVLVLTSPVFALQNDSDDNYFEDIICFETVFSLCKPRPKTQKYMYIEDAI